MDHPDHIIETARLVLRPWRLSDLNAFAQMHRDADVMADAGGPLTDDACRRKLDRYLAAFRTDGYSRWCVEDRQKRFAGYVGINYHEKHHWLGQHDEIGWRLNTQFWGQGLATEAAKAVLDDAFGRLKLSCVFSCTSPTNIRSQAVMMRLSLSRCATQDFVWQGDDGRQLPVLVWKTPGN
jgi:RimJ/RimL family protein N-acetyltransferase